MINEKSLKLKVIIHNKFPKLLKEFYNFQELINGGKNKKKVETSSKYIKSIRDYHSNELCFIIGNGPSLRADDLDKLSDKICFASNRIYEIFKKTKWRPTYYCISDREVLLNNYQMIINQPLKHVFVGLNYRFKYPKLNNAHYIHLICEDFYPNLPKFSDDMLNGEYEGCTVTYMAMQLAIYMGFKTIYLLGMDHNFSVIKKPDGSIEKNTDVKDHFFDNNTYQGTASLYQTTLAYQAAKKYADEHGIKIYNATRGGKLEVFERVDFDSLFENTGDRP